MNLAKHLAQMEPAPLQTMKTVINRVYDGAGMQASLRMGAEIDLLLEAKSNPTRKAFGEVVQKEGLKAAVAWREARLKKSNS